jgi:hypothetical protein
MLESEHSLDIEDNLGQNLRGERGNLLAVIR